MRSKFKTHNQIPITALILLAGAALQGLGQHPAVGTSSCHPPAGMALISDGASRPLFRAENDPKEVAVAAFYLDVFPVTNGDFLAFVRANPRWSRSRVRRLFADKSYLIN